MSTPEHTPERLQEILKQAKELKEQLDRAAEIDADQSLKDTIRENLFRQLQLAQDIINSATPRDVAEVEFTKAISEIAALKTELLPSSEPELIATGKPPPRGAIAGGGDAKQDLTKPNAEYALFASTGDVINVSVKNGKTEISIPTTEGMSVNTKVELARDFVHAALMEGAYKLGPDGKPHFTLKTHDPQFAIAVQKQAELLGYTCDIGNVLNHAALYKNAEASTAAYGLFDSYIGKKIFGGTSYGEFAIGKQMHNISQKVEKRNRQEIQAHNPEMQLDVVESILKDPKRLQQEVAKQLLTTHPASSTIVKQRLDAPDDRSIFSPSRLDDAARFVRRQSSVSPLQRKVSANLDLPISEKTKSYAENLATMGIVGYNYGPAAETAIKTLQGKLARDENVSMTDLAGLGVARAQSAAPRQAPSVPTT